MNRIIRLCQDALNIPLLQQRIIHSRLQTLNLLDHKKIHLRAQPHAEIICNIFVSIRAAISSCLRNNTNGTRSGTPFFGRQNKAVRTSRSFNCLEFDAIKIRIAQLLPEPKEFDGVL